MRFNWTATRAVQQAAALLSIGSKGDCQILDIRLGEGRVSVAFMMHKHSLRCLAIVRGTMRGMLYYLCHMTLTQYYPVLH